MTTSDQNADLLHVFDREVRRADPPPGVRRIATGYALLDVSDAEGWGCLVYSDLSGMTEAELDLAADNLADRIRATKVDFEWKVYGHDAPADLVERLIRRGFEAEESETVMVLELAQASAELLSATVAGCEIRRVTDAAGFADLGAVQSAVWGDAFDWLTDSLASEMRAAPERLSVYVAYLDGRPVSTAWVRFAPGSAFASLWGGSTLPEYRGRGVYTALLTTRLCEARERPGVRYVYVDASEMSRPLLEKRGFRPLTTARACHWRDQNAKPVA